MEHATLVLLLAGLLIPASAQSPLLGADVADTAKTTRQLIDPQVIQNSDGVERKTSEGLTDAYLPILFATSHASNLLMLHNGDVLCFWFSGTWEGNSQVGIVYSRLKKGSHSWSLTKQIDHHVDQSYQNPVGFQAKDGTVYLFHDTQPALKGEGGAKTLLLLSHDNGETWSDPKTIFPKPGSYPRNSLFVMKDGTWLLGMNYQAFTGQGIETLSTSAFVQESKDQGESWHECPPIPDSKFLLQPTIVYTGNGSLLAYLRSAKMDHIFSSTSTDGCTWTSAHPTALPNNNSGIQMLRLKDGHLVLIFNNSSKTLEHEALRKPISVTLSTDDGKTWSSVRDLDTGRPGYGYAERQIKAAGREEYSYPSLIQLPDGTIMVSYTYRRQTIKVVSFPEDWIRQGKPSEGEFKGGPSNQ